MSYMGLDWTTSWANFYDDKDEEGIYAFWKEKNKSVLRMMPMVMCPVILELEAAATDKANGIALAHWHRF